MHKPLQTPWYDKSINALQLAGMSESSQKSYARSVRMLIEHFDGKDPRNITEDELIEINRIAANINGMAEVCLLN